MKKFFNFLLCAFVLQGCAPLVLGAGAAAGYVGIQERDYKEAGEDIALKVKLFEHIGRLNELYVKDLNISVRHGEAFITGVVKEQDEVEAITRNAHQVKGVKNVINVIQLKPYSFKQYVKDKATSTNLRSRFLFTPDVFTQNYEITLVKGEVFIFGWAFTQKEIQTAVKTARTTKGVKKVHNYLRVMADGPQRLAEKKRLQELKRQEKFGVDEVQ